MRQKICIIIISLISVVSVFAKQRENIYIYRNDGLFNAFFSEEVDSLYYSRYDLNNIEHNQYVVQVIATKDSLVKIPLSVIDSISYRTPPNVLKSNVINLTEGYTKYIESHTDSTITFSNSLPQQLKFSLNDIIFYDLFDNDFSNGFAGRVNRITEQSETILVECSSVFLTDIYESYVSLGEYIVVNDSASKSKYRLSPSRAAAEVPFTLSVPLNIGNDNISLSGEIQVGLKIRVVARINPSTQYLELSVIDNEEGNLVVNANGEIEFESKNPNPLRISASIPQMPIFNIALEFAPFLKTAVRGETNIGVSLSSSGRYSIIFEHGKWRTERPGRTGNVSPIDDISLNGYIWGGLSSRIELAAIKNLFDVGLDIYSGPKISANIDLSLINLIDSFKLYDALKDSKATLGFRVEAGLSAGYKISPAIQGSIQFLKFCPSLEVGMYERYLLPIFSNFNVKLNGASALVSSQVERGLIAPCEIGIGLIDSESNRDNYLHPNHYLAEGISGTQISNLFDSLKFNGKYTTFPFVKYWGIYLDASPEKEFNLFAFVYTGGSSASYNEARTWGGYEVHSSEEQFQPTECGVCYSQYNTAPTIENSATSIGKISSDGLFDNELAGLEEGTTYYYRSYAKFNNEYYYGESKCFTTKKQKDPSEEDNPGGNNGDEGTPPVANTLGSINITKHSAMILLNFENIIPGTDCGYFIEEDGNYNGSQLISLGTINGNMSVPLSGLKAGTTYYYQAYARNKYGKSLGSENIFQTEPEPTPSVQTISVDNISDKSADLTCRFSNLPENSRCGAELTSNAWSYRLSMPRKEGISKGILSNLEPETTYTVAGFVESDNNSVYGNDITFTTKPREIPDLSGAWTFTQGYLGAHIVHLNLKLKSKGSNYATYTASGFYGGIGFEMTVYSNLQANIALLALQGAKGCFAGEFDEDFTSISGSSYLYVFSDANWAVSPVWFDEPWSLHR